MFEILNPIELEQVIADEMHRIQLSCEEGNHKLSEDTLTTIKRRAIAKAEQKHTLQQVVKKLDFLLQTSPYKGITLRRSVGILAEELQKEANSE